MIFKAFGDCLRVGFSVPCPRKLELLLYRSLQSKLEDGIPGHKYLYPSVLALWKHSQSATF
jgi:hypothetical protein